MSLRQPDSGYDYRCQRCDHQWRARVPNQPPPVNCACCRSAYWQRPRADGSIVPCHPRKRKDKAVKVVKAPVRSTPPVSPIVQTPPEDRPPIRSGLRPPPSMVHVSEVAKWPDNPPPAPALAPPPSMSWSQPVHYEDAPQPESFARRRKDEGTEVTYKDDHVPESTDEPTNNPEAPGAELSEEPSAVQPEEAPAVDGDEVVEGTGLGPETRHSLDRE